ncbi:hypothetical protein ACIQOU_34600 [Streptomyces sp. NPDC091279]|uniref:hypothetical protein n=1 Tax=Streptomyces sp. NPDC091279 TaxID=3365983 RepID=UPI00380873DC
MRERPEKGEESAKGTGGKLDLSLPQVAGSAMAAVIAAKLASYFGVYGTILGAGLVSVVATCGGSVFQHFFRRTGEQIREVGVAGRPPGPQEQPTGEFGAGTVYRARHRSWRRPVVASALVFGVTMAGITTYELVAGNSFSGHGATTVSDALTGKGTSPSTPTPDGTGADSTPAATDPASPTPAPTDTATGTHGSATPGDDGSSGDATPTPSPSASDGGGDGGASPTPTPSTSATSPEPSASSRSGTAGQDRADPATP